MANPWDKVEEAASIWAERAIKPVTPPDPAAKIAHVALNPKNEQIRQGLDRRVDDVIEQAVHGALDGVVRGVSKPARYQGFVLAIWGGGIGFYVANVLPYMRTVTLSELFQLGIIVFIPTSAAAWLVGCLLRRASRRGS